MRFQTRLFVIWGVIVLLLWAGTGLPVRHAIETSFTRLAADGFAATRRDLHTLQAERIRGMRQAAAMVMNIPDLRALIAEHNFEVSSENLASLQERLDNLADIVGVSFVCVLDARGNVIAQNHGSPWKTLPELNQYVATAPAGSSMISRMFARSTAKTGSADTLGMWSYQQRLYQVVGIPLVFNSDTDGSPAADGGLIMAAPLTDELAVALGQSHKCQVSFLSAGAVAASSFGAQQKEELQTLNRNWDTPNDQVFDCSLDGISYRSSIEPLTDPCSNTRVGTMLIQSDLKDALAARDMVSRRLLISMLCGLAAAGLASFFVSGAVTRPVRELSKAVQRLAKCDLDINIHVHSRDELGELAAAFNDMVRRLRVRRELERVVEETRANSRAKSQFLANMSHEIRTPINGVIGMAELLLRSDLNDRQRRYAAMVKSSAEVLTTLINDILDFSKIEAGKLELESVEFNLHDLIEDVTELLGLKATAKGLEVACDIGREVPSHVRGDPTRLRQIIVNLLNNAIKFTEQGQVIVRVSGNAGDVENSGIRVEVIDTGIGIPADRMDRLFQSFSQVDASTTRRFGGTGLGLAISKQLVELMGGKMGVQSEPGKGSIFSFSIRLESSRASEPANVLSLEGLAGIRVLVVEPNNECREILRRKLSQLGCSTDGVSDVRSASDALDHAHAAGSPYRVAIVDASACGVDALRRQSDLAILSLVALGTETGADGYVTKPVRRAQLVHALQSAIAAPATGQVGSAPRTNSYAHEAGAIGQNTAQSPTPKFRILVAEDNPINQMVASDLLVSEGYACEVVGDGEAAVAAFNLGGYDLVLMDCQMPKLDGFQATSAIRAREIAAKAPARIPIIALTANAGGGDREKCLAAGMDGYCPKPFNVAQLLGMIRSYQNAGSAPPPKANDEPAIAGSSDFAAVAPPETENSFDETGNAPFDTEKFLARCTGNPALAHSVLDKFHDQSHEMIKNLRARLDQSEIDEIGRIAHRLKGTAGILSADNLRDAAVRLEELCRAGDLACITKGVERIDADLRNCVAYLATARQKLDQPGSKADKETVGGP